MNMVHQFSYWMRVRGTYAQCRRFHERLGENNLTPNVFVQDIVESKVYIIDEHESEIAYHIDPDTNTVSEIPNLPSQIETIAEILPELKITLECFDEEDQSNGHTHAYYNKQSKHDHAKIVITSAEDLLKTIVCERS